jgi:hypothetical protein
LIPCIGSDVNRRNFLRHLSIPAAIRTRNLRLRRHPHLAEILAKQHLTISKDSKNSQELQRFSTDLVRQTTSYSSRTSGPQVSNLAFCKIAKFQCKTSWNQPTIFRGIVLPFAPGGQL